MEVTMRFLFLAAFAVGAVAWAGSAEARSPSCTEAIRRLDATPLHSRAAIEQLGRAKSALSQGHQRDCLAHVQQARDDERQYGRRSASSVPSSRYRRASPADHSANELNRRELQYYAPR
jgi:hypothetical protein